MLLLCIAPLTSCSNGIINGLYLSSFVCTARSRNMPCMKVNSMIWMG